MAAILQRAAPITGSVVEETPRRKPELAKAIQALVDRHGATFSLS